ncbi:hypothetical protein VTO73DRAFT_4331 [Trametes versicolor]
MSTMAHRWTMHRKCLHVDVALLELTHRWLGCTNDADQPHPAQTPLRGRHHGGTRVGRATPLNGLSATFAPCDVDVRRRTPDEVFERDSLRARRTRRADDLQERHSRHTTLSAPRRTALHGARGAQTAGPTHQRRRAPPHDPHTIAADTRRRLATVFAARATPRCCARRTARLSHRDCGPPLLYLVFDRDARSRAVVEVLPRTKGCFVNDVSVNRVVPRAVASGMSCHAPCSVIHTRA